MTARTCSAAAIFNSAKKVETERLGRSYAPVFVTVVSSDVDRKTVTFVASDDTGAKRTFSNVPWDNDDMVTDCPTTLPFEPGRPPAPNAEGTLYLSRELLENHSFVGTPKFPRSLL